MGTVFIGVETNYSSWITFISIVSPDDNLYVDSCFTNEPLLNCSGIFHFQKTHPVIHDLIAQLKNNMSCGFIDFDPCSEPPTGASTPIPSPTQSCTRDIVACSAGQLECLLNTSVGVILTLLVIAAAM
ncbi:hypothetical protein GBAR_LOCUS23604 [Geodia barretti]|nr:hypothetical protein GBAR_LOCUS23604 [Geodia barretti]